MPTSKKLTTTYLILSVIMIITGSAGALQIVAGPYLQNLGETSVTIMWITDRNCTSWVQYGTEEPLTQKAFNSQHGLIDADCTIHSITILGLTPAAHYHYKVHSKEILQFEAYKVTYGNTVAADAYSFHTLDKTKSQTSVIVLNDIHESNAIMEKLIKISADKPYDIVFLNGDILGHIEDQQQVINHVLKPCSELFATQTPFVYTRGNHETRGRFARNLSDYVALPEGTFYRAFDCGPVHFIVMDSGEDKEDSHWAYSGLADFDSYRDVQRTWLEKEIQTEASKKAPFRVVIMHMPLYGSNDWHGPMQCQQKWGSLMNKAKVDLLIAGHTHRYEFIKPEPGKHDYPIVIGGSPKPGNAVVTRLDATNEKMTVTMTGDNNQNIGTYTIQRN